VRAQIKIFNAQAQNAQPAFLIGKTKAQIAKVKNKISKLRNFFQKFNKAQAPIAQRLKKILIKRKLSNIFKSIITKVYCFENQCHRYGVSGGGASNRCLYTHYFWRL